MFASLFSPEEWAEFSSFIRQLDMHYLREASRNYCVAAALIDVMRLRFGLIDEAETEPDNYIGRMMEAYLGDGFFNEAQRDRHHGGPEEYHEHGRHHAAWRLRVSTA